MWVRSAGEWVIERLVSLPFVVHAPESFLGQWQRLVPVAASLLADFGPKTADVQQLPRESKDMISIEVLSSPSRRGCTKCTHILRLR